jgi:hypothetical protein
MSSIYGNPGRTIAFTDNYNGVIVLLIIKYYYNNNKSPLN